MSSGDLRSFLRGVLIFLCESANSFVRSIVMSILVNRSRHVNSFSTGVLLFSNSILSYFARSFSLLCWSSSHLFQVVFVFPRPPTLLFSDWIFIQEFSFHGASAVCSFLSYPVILVKILRSFVFIFIQSCYLFRWIQFSCPCSSYPIHSCNSFLCWEFLWAYLVIYSSLFDPERWSFPRSFLFPIFSIISRC